MELIPKHEAMKKILELRPGEGITFKGYVEGANVVHVIDIIRDRVRAIRFENERTVFYADVDCQQVISKKDFFVNDFLNTLEFDTNMYIQRDNESGGPQTLENLFILVNYFVKNDYIIEFSPGSDTIWFSNEELGDIVVNEDPN